MKKFIKKNIYYLFPQRFSSFLEVQSSLFNINKVFFLIILFVGFFNFLIFFIVRIFFSANINFIDSTRIGHFVIQGCLYTELLKNKKKNSIYLCYFSANVSNNFLFYKFKKKIKVADNYFVISVIAFQHLLDFMGISSKISDIKLTNKSKFWKWDLIKHNTINFTNIEKTKGSKILKDKLNINLKDKYVCLIVRDDAYLNDKNSDHHYRNFNIDIFDLAAKELIRLGYKVVRMGKKVRKEIKLKNSNYIDYANSSHRSDFLDFFLIKNCAYVVSNVTGPDNIATIFKKPICFIVLALGFIFPYKNDNIILPRFFINKKKKLLNLSQACKAGLFTTNKSSFYLKKKIFPLYPTSNNIKMLVREMHLKINNKLKINKNMQKKFWQLYYNPNSDKKSNGIIEVKNFKSQISNYFLLKNYKWFVK